MTIEETSVAIDVSGLAVRSARGEVLTAPNVNSINTYDAPDTVVPRPISGTLRGGSLRVELPAKAIAMLALEP